MVASYHIIKRQRTLSILAVPHVTVQQSSRRGNTVFSFHPVTRQLRRSERLQCVRAAGGQNVATTNTTTDTATETVGVGAFGGGGGVLSVYVLVAVVQSGC
jgi:hypothetical protein